ncbi:MAG: hypothetical protein ACKO1M_04235 [Planctomycetota bacterium]
MARFYRRPHRRPEDQKPQRRQAAIRLAWRPMFVALADLLASLALAFLEIGQRHGRPRLARRAGGLMVKAVGYYLEAGMGRKAAAVTRLAERCRLAWLRHEAGEGWR